MKTIVNSTTGIVLYAAKEFELKKDEIAVDGLCDLEFDAETQDAFWDFEKQVFTIKNK